MWGCICQTVVSEAWRYIQSDVSVFVIYLLVAASLGPLPIYILYSPFYRGV